VPASRNIQLGLLAVQRGLMGREDARHCFTEAAWRELCFGEVAVEFGVLEAAALEALEQELELRERRTLADDSQEETAAPKHPVGSSPGGLAPEAKAQPPALDRSPSFDPDGDTLVPGDPRGGRSSGSLLGPGARIDGYQVERLLGQGGMGAVYLVHKDGKPYALKLLNKINQSALARFSREAEALLRVKLSKNVVRVHSFSKDGETPYLVMDYVPAEGLDASLVPGQPFELTKAAELVASLAETLHEVHTRGVIHRDLKPANILIAKADGAPVLTDFGLAKALDSESLTQTSELIGTPHYMPPEQISGGAASVTASGDLWALGVILYELCTGERPFEAASMAGLTSRILFVDPTPPRQRNHDVPRDLEDVILRCLEKEPSRRYESAQALAADLRRWLAGERVETGTRGSAVRALARLPARPLTLIACLVLIGGLMAAAWALHRHNEGETQALRRAAAKARLGQLLGQADAELKRCEISLSEGESAQALRRAQTIIALLKRSDARLSAGSFNLDGSLDIAAILALLRERRARAWGLVSRGLLGKRSKPDELRAADQSISSLPKSMKSPALRLAQARLRGRFGRAQSALSLLSETEARQLGPEALLLRGELLLASRQFSLAKDLLTSLRVQPSIRLRATLAAVQALIPLRKFALAKRLLGEIKESPLRRRRRVALLDLASPQRSIEGELALSTARPGLVGDPGVAIAVARAALARGRPSDARGWLLEARQDSFHRHEAALLAAEASLALEGPAAARITLEELAAEALAPANIRAEALLLLDALPQANGEAGNQEIALPMLRKLYRDSGELDRVRRLFAEALLAHALRARAEAQIRDDVEEEFLALATVDQVPLIALRALLLAVRGEGKAVALARRALIDEPGSPFAHAALARIEPSPAHRSAAAAAIRESSAAPARLVRSARVLFERGHRRKDARDLAQAEILRRIALARAPWVLSLERERLQTLWESQRLEELARQLPRAARLAPREPEFGALRRLLELAKGGALSSGEALPMSGGDQSFLTAFAAAATAERVKNPSKALLHIDAALAFEARNLRARRLRLRALESLGRSSEAARERALIKDFEDPKHRTALGLKEESYRLRGEHPKRALAAIQRALFLAPELYRFQLERAQLFYRINGKSRIVEAILDFIGTYLYDFPHLQNQTEHPRLLRSTFDFDRALDEGKAKWGRGEALSDQALWLVAMFLYLDSFDSSERMDWLREACAWAERAVAGLPAVVAPLIVRGHLRVLRGDRRGLTDLAEARRYYPKEAVVLVPLALWEAREGRMDEAFELLTGARGSSVIFQLCERRRELAKLRADPRWAKLGD